jgi:predicted nucleic acid-binding protein
MTHIYIDTNVFLDFYQSATDRLKVFKDLHARAERILVTEQTVAEFRRNRVALLVDLAANIKKTSNVQIFTTAVVRELPEFQEWKKSRDSAREIAERMAEELMRWTLDSSTDLVHSEFEELIKSCQYIRTSEGAITRAHRRKLIGQPPTSPDKHTIGDELIWESLLEGAKGDLVVVSRDKTFLENQALLKEEFDEPGNRSLVLVTRVLSEALERAGRPSVSIEAAEENIKSEKRNARTYQHVKCWNCGSDLKWKARSDDDDALDEDDDFDDFFAAFCLYCPHCKFYPLVY